MYQALYRKYRPKTFDDVVDQDVIVRTLKNAVINDKISHAYLFAGPRGCGKTSIAKIFAKLVNCQNSKDGIPCEMCVCCTQNNEQNMDIIEMDAASNNGVDEIREINNKINLVPSLGKYKVYIIDEVHMLTIGAFNALLKTLEEPPKHAIFILATTDPHKVPVTILSRCQRFDLKKISNDSLFERLKYICDSENVSITDDAISLIARLGDGSLRDAIGILDQVISYTDSQITVDDVHDVNGSVSTENISLLVNYVMDNNLTEIIKKIGEYTNRGKSIIKITEEIILFLRNCILENTTDDYIVDDKNIYREINNKISVSDLLNYINIFNESLLEMKKFSNPRMILELGFIKIVNFKISHLNAKEIPNTLDQNNFNVIEKENKVELTRNDDKFKKNINNNYHSKDVQDFITIRVNNTLSKFSKKDTIDLKNKIDIINDYIMNEIYSSQATMVLDGEIKAVGDNYIIFVYKTEHLANMFNENIKSIETLLYEVFNKKYNIIAVDLNEWNNIKEKFNSKKEKYEFQEELKTVDEIFIKPNKEDNDNMKNLFGDIVEYN